MDFNLLLNFDVPFNCTLFDTVVTAFYEGDSSKRSEAQNVLMKFQNHPDSWRFAAQILEQSSSLHAKFIGLSVLEKFVIVRWNTLSPDDRQGIRNYIAALVVKLPTSQGEGPLQKAYLSKVNIVLVHIVKKEWPTRWPTFISEIVALSRTNMNLCENNMKILKLLSEEIFDFSEDHMIQAKMQKLKTQMVNEFDSVIDLCQQVLAGESEGGLVSATLEAMTRFLSWVPISTALEPRLVDSLQRWLAGSGNQRNLALQCCSEIMGLDVPEQYHQTLVQLYQLTRQCLSPHMNVIAHYESADEEGQALVHNLALFLTSYLDKRLELAESTFSSAQALEAHTVLLDISCVGDRELWKICLEYWAKLIDNICKEVEHDGLQQRSTTFAGVLHKLRYIMIDRMVTPDEVLVVQDDDGEAVWEFNKQSDTATLYQSMRHVLCCLTRLDAPTTEGILQEKLAGQMSAPSGWSWAELSKVSWAVGAVSGAMDETREAHFLTDITQHLIKLLNESKSKDQAFVVVSSLMYIASQYPRFLAAHPDFRAFVLQKLNECMHDPSKGVQEMAANAFLKICKGCRHALDASMVTNIYDLTSDLDLAQKCMVYEGIGYVVSVAPVQELPRLVDQLAAMPNKDFTSILQECQSNAELFATPRILDLLVSVLKRHTAVCRALGDRFLPQLRSMTPDMVTTYQQASVMAQDFPANSNVMRLLFKLKRNIINLVDTFISSTQTLDAVHEPLVSKFLDTFFHDYRSSAQGHNTGQRAEVGVPKLAAHVFEKLDKNQSWAGLLEATLDMVFRPTLPMISQDFVQSPEHRHEFYVLIKVLNQTCLEVLIRQPKEAFTLWVDSILWGIKHPTPNISHLALRTCLDMMNQIREHPDEDVASEFYQAYYLAILRDILAILTDPDLENAFEYQSQVLAQMLQIVQEGEIYTRLFNPNEVDNPLMSNAEYLQGYVRQLLCEAFPLLQKSQIEVLVLGMFEYSDDLPRFQHDLRDFLVDIRQVGEDRGDIGREEKEAELELLKFL